MIGLLLLCHAQHLGTDNKTSRKEDDANRSKTIDDDEGVGEQLRGEAREFRCACFSLVKIRCVRTKV